LSYSKKYKEMEIGAVLPASTGLQFKTGDWRTERPVLDYQKCIDCLICWCLCPDSAIRRKGGKVEINYDYCKGCGICSVECPVKAITMKREEV